jgi:hypothetical protein
VIFSRSLAGVRLQRLKRPSCWASFVGSNREESAKRFLYPDYPYDFDEIWARAFDPQAKEYVKFLVTEPENLTREALYAKERVLIADVKEELRQGRRCQVYATYTGEKDVTLRLETVLRREGLRVAVPRSSVPTDKREDWYERQLKAGVEVVTCHPQSGRDWIGPAGLSDTLLL